MKKLVSFPLQLSFIFLILLAFSLPSRAQTIVCLETVVDDICMELLDTEAPIAAQNFLSYVQRGTYRSSFLHQLVNDGENTYFVGGKYVITGISGLNGIQEVTTRPPVSNEPSISNTRGTVALVPDDPDNPDSGTSKFLINMTDNPALDTLSGGYTVFARILGFGMDSLDGLVSLVGTVDLGDGDLSAIPVISQDIPIENSIGITIADAYIYDGDISDFEQGGGDSTDSSGDDPVDDGSTDDGSNGDGDTPTPGEGETLYENAVCVDTNAGEFCMELLPDSAPNTVTNFLNYIS
ncbi:MAG: hypothetical protein HOK55_04585, partial [Gammaproteobacteria bacterium]|nr:hypothetical protein [Gammaproteobacteria bacterium]